MRQQMQTAVFLLCKKENLQAGKKSVNLLFSIEEQKMNCSSFEMITIILNGEQRDINDGSTVDDILNIIGAEKQRVAVVVNENIVYPQKRSSFVLQENDQVEVLAFVGGG